MLRGWNVTPKPSIRKPVLVAWKFGCLWTDNRTLNVIHNTALCEKGRCFLLEISCSSLSESTTPSAKQFISSRQPRSFSVMRATTKRPRFQVECLEQRDMPATLVNPFTVTYQ